MAFKSGHNAFIAVDSVAGSPVNLSTYADSFTFPQPIDQHDVSTFGDGSKDFIPGLADGGEISMSGPLDVALGTFIGALKAGQAAGSSSATVQYGPGGSVSGQIKQSAEVYVSAYNVSTSVSGRTEYDISLQVTGSVTNDTW